jgi:hypothetical protein
LIVSAGLLEPVEGSQNLIVLSYEPLASFNAIVIDSKIIINVMRKIGH